MEDFDMSSSSKARGRILALLDENSFVEIGALVTARATDFSMKPEQTPSDGVITGYGVIVGGLVYVFSQHADVLGGSVGEMHARKIANLYELAMNLEDEYSLEIPVEDLQNMNTVNDVITYLARHGIEE